MVARQDAHDFAALGVHPDVRPERIHHVDGFGLGQLPRTGLIGIGLRRQRPHRAQVDDVALKVRIQRFVQVTGDLGILAAPRLTHLVNARDLGREAHAAGAGNAAGHLGRHQRAEVQILGRALGFAVAREVDAIRHRLILKVAFAALIADRAVERVVDEQELHHPFAGLLDHRAVGLDDRRLTFRPRTQVFHLHRAGGGGFGRAAHDLDQTHAAVARDRQALVIAEPGNFDPGFLAGLNQGHRPVHLDLVPVDDDFLQIAHASLTHPAGLPRRLSFPVRP